MSGILFWAAGLGLVAVLTLGIVDVGSAAVAQAQANAAADAAALAGAAAGAGAAEEAAIRNGATLISFTQFGDFSTVIVEQSGAVVTGYAERILEPVPKNA